MKVGQRIDCYNVKDNHTTLKGGQTLIDNHCFQFPDLMYGFWKWSNSSRADSGISCAVGIDTVKVGTLIIKIMSHTAEFQLHGMNVEIHFDYSGEEERTNDYPGDDESFEIHKLIINGKNCINALNFGDVEKEIIEAIKAQSNES